MPSALAEIKVNLIERPGSLKELAYREIKNHLMAGRLGYAQIYSAGQFADMLGVSRTPVREALLQLASEGFLVFIEGRGFRIKEFSEQEIRDIFETRQVIETYVVERLAGNVSSEDIHRLEQSLQQMTEQAGKGDAFEFLEADKEFHMTLVRRHNNLHLVSIMEDIRNYICVFGLKAISQKGRTQEVIREHGQILKALRQKDKKNAVRAVCEHLVTTKRYLLEKEKTV